MKKWNRLEKLLFEGLDSGNSILDTNETRSALRKEARRRLAEHKAGKPATT